ncbi:hypothetical protein PQR37_19545 [Paraburkholderia nemoris]|uniref:hypothetical protein n=1 Tax=Paraburkholderia nemoris TaxID=2793076 RepID=UPI0038BAF512
MIATEFRADLVAHIDAQLKGLDYSPKAAGDARRKPAQYLMLLLRLLRRIPAARPRRVFQAPEFAVPPAHAVGYQTLARAVESGTTLRPCLSTLVRKLNERDDLLDDWGIHHFHLGNASHEKRADFVARTDEVAFAMVRADAVYFLTATSHDPAAAPFVWTETGLMDIVHRNWPALIATSRMPLNGQVLTAEKRAELRQCRVNASVTVSDGTVYYAPGGGMMSNGDGGTDYIYQMQLLRRLDHLEATIGQHEAQIRARLGVGKDAALALKARFSISIPAGFAIEVYEPTSRTLIAT